VQLQQQQQLLPPCSFPPSSAVCTRTAVASLAPDTRAPSPPGCCLHAPTGLRMARGRKGRAQSSEESRVLSLVAMDAHRLDLFPIFFLRQIRIRRALPATWARACRTLILVLLDFCAHCSSSLGAHGGWARATHCIHALPPAAC
jgi:hypothetical protein